MTKKSLDKILYVEDDADIAEVTIMTMQELGNFNVKHCISGKKCIEEVVKFDPDLIILDMMMPDMDGIETLHQLKTIEIVKDIPVIFMTAKMQNHERQSYLNEGAIGVIMKPFDPMKLCDEIRKIWQDNNKG